MASLPSRAPSRTSPSPSPSPSPSLPEASTAAWESLRAELLELRAQVAALYEGLPDDPPTPPEPPDPDVLPLPVLERERPPAVADPFPAGRPSAEIRRWRVRVSNAHGLSPAERLVLECLTAHGYRGEAFPSLATIMRETALSRRGVQSALGRLTAVGIVTRHARGGGRRSTLYRFQGCTECTPGVHSVHLTTGALSAPEEKRNELKSARARPGGPDGPPSRAVPEPELDGPGGYARTVESWIELGQLAAARNLAEAAPPDVRADARFRAVAARIEAAEASAAGCLAHEAGLAGTQTPAVRHTARDGTPDPTHEENPHDLTPDVAAGGR